jgi:uncharacterized protein YbjT (DUF2867 family)
MAIDFNQTLEASTVLLLGASSQIGVFAIPQLVLTGFQVLAVSRKGKPEGYPAFEQVAWLSEAEALGYVNSCDHLLSTGPLELAKTFLTAPTTPNPEPVTPTPEPVTPTPEPVTPGLTRGPFKSAVIFSSSSVESKHDSNDPNERNQIKNMLDLESELQFLAEESRMKLVIFRPTLIYGCGLDTNISRLAQWVNRFGFIPVNGNANGLRQPVHADDLASAAISALLKTESLPQIMTLAGGETLSYLEMVTRIFTAMKKPPRLMRLPQWIFTLAVKLAGIFGMIKGTNTEMVKRQKVDLTFDNQKARECLNYWPRKFTPGKKDFLLPEFD